jgi:hypothetical protein
VVAIPACVGDGGGAGVVGVGGTVACVAELIGGGAGVDVDGVRWLLEATACGWVCADIGWLIPGTCAREVGGVATVSAGDGGVWVGEGGTLVMVGCAVFCSGKDGRDKTVGVGAGGGYVNGLYKAVETGDSVGLPGMV